jgi:hypothetical protein
MTIDFNSTLDKISRWGFGSPVINGLLSNPFICAAVISATMIFLIMFMYPAKPGTSIHVVCKMFVYMFGMCVCLVFLHDGVLRYTYQDRGKLDNEDAFMESATNGDVVYHEKTTTPPLITTPIIDPKPVELEQTIIEGGNDKLTGIKVSSQRKNMFKLM